MPYYTRILTKTREVVARSALEADLHDFQASLTGNIEEKNWKFLEIEANDGTPVLQIERNEVAEGSLAFDEIEEFRAEIVDCLPATGSKWVADFLSQVRTIYAFQILVDFEDTERWRIVTAVRAKIREMVGGIIQADGEGFTNEDGYNVLWQFSDNVTGLWWMAVLKDGEWKKFQMDLGKSSDRDAFWAGEVPLGAKLKS